MPRLTWVFTGRTATLLVLSCCGSILFLRHPFLERKVEWRYWVWLDRSSLSSMKLWPRFIIVPMSFKSTIFVGVDNFYFYFKNYIPITFIFSCPIKPLLSWHYHAKKLPPIQLYSRDATCIYRCHGNLMLCRNPYTGLLVLVFLGMFVLISPRNFRFSKHVVLLHAKMIWCFWNLLRGKLIASLKRWFYCFSRPFHDMNAIILCKLVWLRT